MKTLNVIEHLELARANDPVKPMVSDQVDSVIARSLAVETGAGSAGVRGGKEPTQSGSGIANIASEYDPEAIVLLGEPFGEVLSDLCRVACKPQQKLNENATPHGPLAARLRHPCSQISHTLQAVAVGPVHLSAVQQ